MNKKFHPYKKTLPLKTALILSLALLLGGCAFMNRENTPALNYVEENLIPEKTGWKIATFPVVFPLGLVAVTTDMVLIHPALVIDDAAGDTGDTLWTKLDFENSYVTQCASLPWRSAFTPVVFTGDFLVRSLFNIPSRDKIMQEKRKNEENVTLARELMEQGKYNRVLETLDRIDFSRLEQKDQIDFVFMRLTAAYKTRRYEYFRLSGLAFLLSTEHASQVMLLLNEMRTSVDPMARWHAYTFYLRSQRELTAQKNIALQVLKDSNPILRYYALSWFDQRYREPGMEDILPELEIVAKDDSDPMNRAFANQISRRIKALLKEKDQED